MNSALKQNGLLSAASLDARSHVEHGMFLGNVNKAALSQQT